MNTLITKGLDEKDISFIKNLYTDDTALFSDSPEGLQHLMYQITVEGDPPRLKLNTAKT